MGWCANMLGVLVGLDRGAVRQKGRETDDQSYDVNVSSWIANVLLIRGQERGSGGMATEGKGCLGSGGGYCICTTVGRFLLYLKMWSGWEGRGEMFFFIS